MSPCCSSHILWRCIIFRDHSHKWYLQVVGKTCFSSTHLSWPRESSSRQTDLAWTGPRMNITVLQLLLFLHRNTSSPKLCWQCPFLRMWRAYRMAQCFTRKCEIKNLQLLSEVGESFQPPGAPPDFTTNSDLEARYAVVSQARCPLISWISCSKSWLPYYYISSMQL